MSTGCECQFVEYEEGRWYYLLERMGASPNAWDWREEATAYGPFPSLDAARTSLSDNHANPGGHFVISNAELRKDEVLERLVENAWEPTDEGGLVSPSGRILSHGPFLYFRPG